MEGFRSNRFGALLRANLNHRGSSENAKVSRLHDAAPDYMIEGIRQQESTGKLKCKSYTQSFAIVEGEKSNICDEIAFSTISFLFLGVGEHWDCTFVLCRWEPLGDS